MKGGARYKKDEWRRVEATKSTPNSFSRTPSRSDPRSHSSGRKNKDNVNWIKANPTSQSRCWLSCKVNNGTLANKNKNFVGAYKVGLSLPSLSKGNTSNAKMANGRGNAIVIPFEKGAKILEYERSHLYEKTSGRRASEQSDAPSDTRNVVTFIIVINRLSLHALQTRKLWHMSWLLIPCPVKQSQYLEDRLQH